MAEGVGATGTVQDFRVAHGVKLFLVRHAKAGDRERWTRPDHLRPLTKSGRRQAAGLVDLHADERTERIVSSPYVRCVQTVEPLAAVRGVPIEHHDALAEGAPLAASLALLERARDGEFWCTHGDVVENLIGHLQATAVPGADADLCKKGSTWVLTLTDGRVVKAKYLLPPR